MAWTRKKLTKVLEKLERKNNVLEKEELTKNVNVIFHGGFMMWIIKDEADNDFDRMFHTFQIEQAIDCILERIAISG